MKFIGKRPALLAWATTLALFAAQIGHHGPRGFHQW
jgi:hypothetical protein